MRKKTIFITVVIFFSASCATQKPPSAAANLIEGKDFGFYFQQGIQAITQEDYPTAVEQFKKAIILNPKSARAHNLCGIAYFQQKDFGKAEEQFWKAVAVEPSYEEAFNNLGSVFFIYRDFDKAEEMFRKALTISPDSISANYSLGTILLLTGKIEEGGRYLSRGVELDPKFMERQKNLVTNTPSSESELAEVYFAYAKAYAAKGNVEKTVEYLEKARKSGFRDWHRINEEKEFGGLREDPRISEFIKRDSEAASRRSVDSSDRSGGKVHDSAAAFPGRLSIG